MFVDWCKEGWRLYNELPPRGAPAVPDAVINQVKLDLPNGSALILRHLTANETAHGWIECPTTVEEYLASR